MHKRTAWNKKQNTTRKSQKHEKYEEETRTRCMWKKIITKQKQHLKRPKRKQINKENNMRTQGLDKAENKKKVNKWDKTTFKHQEN